jgi:hypothetical protein
MKEQDPTGVGRWQLATSWHECRNEQQWVARRQWSRKRLWALMKVGNDAASETSLVSYCYKKQHNTTEVWEWQRCHYNDQDGGDAASCSIRRRFKPAINAASRPTRQRFKPAMMPQDKTHAPVSANEGRQWCRNKSAMMPQEYRQVLVSHCFVEWSSKITHEWEGGS